MSKKKIKAVSAGGYHALILTEDGVVYGAGDIPVSGKHYEAPVKMLEGVKAAAAGLNYSIFLMKNDDILVKGELQGVNMDEPFDGRIFHIADAVEVYASPLADAFWVRDKNDRLFAFGCNYENVTGEFRGMFKPRIKESVYDNDFMQVKFEHKDVDNFYGQHGTKTIDLDSMGYRLSRKPQGRKAYDQLINYLKKDNEEYHRSEKIYGRGNVFKSTSPEKAKGIRVITGKNSYIDSFTFDFHIVHINNFYYEPVECDFPHYPFDCYSGSAPLIIVEGFGAGAPTDENYKKAVQLWPDALTQWSTANILDFGSVPTGVGMKESMLWYFLSDNGELKFLNRVKENTLKLVAKGVTDFSASSNVSVMLTDDNRVFCDFSRTAQIGIAPKKEFVVV